MENKKEIEKALEENYQTGVELRQKLKELELQNTMPFLREKYEGKFFKFIDYEKHILYLHCKEITSTMVGKFDTFRITEKSIEISFNTDILFNICITEITKQEYYNKINDIKELIKLM
jgi:hypothetical protein